MSTSNYNDNPHLDKTRDAVLADWLKTTGDAIEALAVWRSYLQAWKDHGILVSDEMFMSLVQNMAEAGCLEWLNAQQADIDLLRAVLTGGE